MADFEARMAALRARFASRAVEEAGAIRTHLAENDHDALRAICHGLAGTGGTFGFPAISEAALAVEEAIDADADADVVARLAATLLGAIDALPQGR